MTVRYPGLPTGPGELLEFDISKLDSLTLRQLMDFVAACQAHAKVRGGGAQHPCQPWPGQLACMLVCAACYLPPSTQVASRGLSRSCHPCAGLEGCKLQPALSGQPAGHQSAVSILAKAEEVALWCAGLLQPH